MSKNFLDKDGVLYLWQKIKTWGTGLFVQKVDGKGLSTNDYTTDEKTKLAGIETGANKTTVEDSLTSTSTTNALSAAQGKVLDEKIKAINTNMEDLGAGDMLKSTYDVNGDGVVDDAEKLGGQLPGYYAALEDLNSLTDSHNTLSNKVGANDLNAGDKTNITDAVNYLYAYNDSVNSYEIGALKDRVGMDETLSSSFENLTEAANTLLSVVGGTSVSINGKTNISDLVSDHEDRLQQTTAAVGTDLDEKNPKGSLYARVKQNAFDISEHASLIQNKADIATSLSGYGITDAYTKTEADTAIATAVANAGHTKRAIVTSLPAVSAADPHTIYMILDTSVASGDAYKEYMLIDGAMVQVGDTTVDLTDYMKTADLVAITNSELDAICVA